jgi:hypothetical protein
MCWWVMGYKMLCSYVEVVTWVLKHAYQGRGCSGSGQSDEYSSGQMPGWKTDVQSMCISV